MTGIKIDGLSKKFRKKNVLDNISVEFKPNKIYGLLGRNGAGKSTLLNIIANRLYADQGTLTLDGENLVENDNTLGRLYLMNDVDMYSKSMRLDKIFEYTEQFYGSFDYEYAEKLAERFKIDTHQKFGKFSTGYHTIAKLIIALCVPADYIFLDEPVLGLDANHRTIFYEELMTTYSERPRTFVVATHLIEEITNILEHVIIVSESKITIDEDVEDILAKSHLIVGPKVETKDYVEGLNIVGKESLGNLQGYYVYGDLNDDKILPDTVQIERVDLQKMFIYLTNQGGENGVNK